jgi:hypothetical protein
MLRLFSALSCAALLLFSCIDQQKEGYLSEISSMNQQLDSMEVLILEGSIDTIASWQQSCNAVEIRIKNNLLLNKVDMNFGRKMDDYKRMRRMLNPLNRNYVKIRASIAEEKETLSNLKKDIEAGVGKRDLYKKYVDFEKGKINQISILLDDYFKTKEEALSIYNTLHPELYALSITLLSQKS